MAGTRNLRVCILATYDISETGGVLHHAQSLAQVLRAHGDEVTLVGPSSRPIDQPHVHGFGGVVTFRANGSVNKMAIFVPPWAVRRFFKEHAFDVIHVHEPLNPSLPYWAAWFTPRVAKVATFHAFGEVEPRGLRFARALTAPLMRHHYQRAIAVSEPAQRWAAPSWKRPMTIIPNGVNTRAFRPDAGPLSTDPGAPLRLLFVGRVGDERKGFRHLLEAYRRLRAREVPVTLDVVGDLGGAPPPPHLPGMTVHGSVSLAMLQERYRACDLFVAPSTGQESFGIVLLEAMATARPMVVSAIDGYRQVADERGACLVPPGDPAALERAIAELAADPTRRWRMGVWNRSRAESFDWEQVTARVREEYLAAIDAKAGHPAPRAAEPDAEARASGA